MSILDSLRRSSNTSEEAMAQPTQYKDTEHSAQSDGDTDSSVSPISEESPPWSGTRWTRFFPELSSHFSVVSPTSTRTQPSTAGIQPIVRHLRQNSADSAETKTGPSSLSSVEPVDDASSCYSRRSSVTSVNSELSPSACRSADAFSIISPIKAGVFDDSVSVQRSSSTMTTRRQSVADTEEKPLPREPPIQMAPLSIRRKTKSRPTICEDTFEDPTDPTASEPLGRQNRTLSQAAEELENALADLTEHRARSPSPLPSLDAPLQVSRGNMDLIATRAAPRPPVSPHQNRNVAKASSEEEAKHAKRLLLKGRVPFSFSVPGFGKRHHRPQLRSLSNPSVDSGLEQKHARHREALASKRPEDKTPRTARSSVNLSPPAPTQRPVSTGSERELRLKLPRLQTKEVQSAGPIANDRPFPIASGDESIEEIRKPKPKSTRKALSDPDVGKLLSPSEPGKSDTHGPHSNMDLVSGPQMIYELEADFPPQKIEKSVAVSDFVPSGQMPSDLPDRVIHSILQQCCSLPDLFNLAVTNKQFYRVFKQHELGLIKRTVFTMSPPAWELREMSPPWDSEWQVLDLDAPVPEYTPASYLDRYVQDIYTLVKLKLLILARCSTFLRPETIRGLAGVDDARATELDNAFWRVWTFCRIFGCGKGREGDIVGQMDWLNGGVMATNQCSSVPMSITGPFGMNNVLFEPPEGFGRGNQGGLSKSQLYDMTEIWTCLGVLLQPIQGKCKEAREAGVFDGHDVSSKDPSGEEASLEEWTYYILTLGPSAVLALGSIATVDNPAEIFQKAKTMGLTKWERADSSRSFFFREAVSKAYKPRENPSPRRSPQLRQAASNSSRSSRSRNSSPAMSLDGDQDIPPHRRRQAAYAAQLRNRRNQPQIQVQVSFEQERPISNYSVIMSRLAGVGPSRSIHAPVPATPTPLQPAHPNTHNIRIAYTPALPPPPPVRVPAPGIAAFYQPQVRDPVDQAIDMMVHELGFHEEDAKWALKITDSGEGINPNAAVSLLIRAYQNREQSNSATRCSPRLNSNSSSSFLSSVINSQESLNSGWRWAEQPLGRNY